MCCQHLNGVSGNELSLRLLSGAMPDDDQYARRLGFWLRMARERSGKSQQGAAEHLGFSTKSKSTISDYENGVTVPALRVLRKLAVWYDSRPTIGAARIGRELERCGEVRVGPRRCGLRCASDIPTNPSAQSIRARGVYAHVLPAFCE